MYNHYYSSSDVQLYLSSYDHTKVIKVDTALSLGYSLRQTSAPIYSLGSRETQFFSVGNTVGHGTLTIAFTDEEYLKYCLEQIKEFLSKEKLFLNKKTRIYRDTNNFIFLGRDSNGKYARYRTVKRKLRKNLHLYKNNKINLSCIVSSIICYDSLRNNKKKSCTLSSQK